MQKGFMFIDETIILDFPMSKNMKEAVDNLDNAFETEDELLWNKWHEITGVIAKTDNACNMLTHEQMVSIWERYGTGP